MRCSMVRSTSDATLWRTSGDMPSAVFGFCVTAAGTVTAYVTERRERYRRRGSRMPSVSI